MNEWLEDNNGNRCGTEYFGSVEAAQAALDSLKNCKNCTNCSDCSRCSGCSDCSYCSDCSGCSGCSYILGLKDQKDSVGSNEVLLAAPAVPRIESIHQKVYAAVTQPNAFDMSNWHTCGTTHCRGGWVVMLAGPGGKALEDFHNSELAAMLIYRASGYHINPARFYDSNADALADMQRLADDEAHSASSS